jgi:hypothetical protein
VRNNVTWLEEFKKTDWFSKILLLFPYLLGLSAFIAFFIEWLKTGVI